MSDLAAKVLSIVSSFGLADDDLPAGAMRTALDSWDQLSEVLLACLTDISGEPDVENEDANVAFLVAHIAGEKRDGRAFGPLCEIGRNPTLTESIFGDALTETYASLLVSTFSDDLQQLQALIEDDGGEEFARSEGLLALAWLTLHGRVPTDWTRAYLERLSGEIGAPGNFVWYGWQRAVAALRLGSLEPLVKEAFEDGRISNDLLAFAEFQDDLREGPSILVHDKVHLVEDVIQELSASYWFSEQYRLERRASPDAEEPEDWAPLEPATNPFRNIGRNDPCPCGSGKKFKKCCLLDA